MGILGKLREWIGGDVEPGDVIGDDALQSFTGDEKNNPHVMGHDRDPVDPEDFQFDESETEVDASWLGNYEQCPESDEHRWKKMSESAGRSLYKCTYCGFEVEGPDPRDLE